MLRFGLYFNLPSEKIFIFRACPLAYARGRAAAGSGIRPHPSLREGALRAPAHPSREEVSELGLIGFMDYYQILQIILRY